MVNYLEVYYLTPEANHAYHIASRGRMNTELIRNVVLTRVRIPGSGSMDFTIVETDTSTESAFNQGNGSVIAKVHLEQSQSTVTVEDQVTNLDTAGIVELIPGKVVLRRLAE